MIEPEDDAEDGCCMCELCWRYGCMCELCWRYGWHSTAPWYARLAFNIRRLLGARSAVRRKKSVEPYD